MKRNSQHYTDPYYHVQNVIWNAKQQTDKIVMHGFTRTVQVLAAVAVDQRQVETLNPHHLWETWPDRYHL